MSEDSTPLDQTGPETATEEVVTDLDALEDHEPEASPEEDTPEPSEDDFDELDFEGEKYRIPKKLKPGFMMQADYTRKTQEVAATRQELEAKAKAIEEQAKTVSEINEDRKKLILMDAHLERYNKVNWNEYFDKDPFEAQKHHAAFQRLEKERDRVEATLKENEGKRAATAASERNTRFQEAISTFTQSPGWSQETDAKLEKFVNGLGISNERFAHLLGQEEGPALAKAIQRAFLADQAITTKQQAAAPKPVQTAPIKPLATVTAKSGTAARKSLSDMSMDEYVAARAAGRKV